MADVWVQFLRNLSCNFKSLLPPDLAIMQPAHSLVHQGSPHFKGQFSKLEVVIGLFQAAGACFCLLNGLKGVVTGFSKAAQVVQWRNAVFKLRGGSKGKQSARGDMSKLKEALAAQDAANSQGLLVAICLLGIGGGFIVLSLSSFKLVHDGPVMWALIIMEVALVYLLYTMGKGVRGGQRVAEAAKDPHSLAQLQTQELQSLRPLLPPPPDTHDSGWLPRVDIPPAQENISRSLQNATSLHEEVCRIPQHKLVAWSRQKELQTKIDAVLFLLNLVAFWGYFIIPVTYFYPNEAAFLRYCGYWPGHDRVAWWGNLAGDVAWTIEPLLILATPYLLRQQQPKEKSE